MTKEEIANILLDLQIISISPKELFTFASGIKSPIYCDNRLLMGHVTERRRVVETLLETVKEHGIAFDVIAGVATASVPLAAWVADAENAPMIYVRPEKKTYGREKQIEGILKRGQKVLVVEDLVSTGKSSANVIDAIRRAGGIVDNCVSIFTYGFRMAQKKFNEINCKLVTLTDLETLLDLAVERKKITLGERKELIRWKRDPEKWKRSEV